MDKIKKLRNTLEQRKGRKAQLENHIQQLQNNLKLQTRRAGRYERALAIVKQVGLETQKALEYRLAEQVSLALTTVFDDPYKLVVEFAEKRGKTEADLLFERRGMQVQPLGSVGGGMIDVASFALRVAYHCMRQDFKPRPVLVLDEPFRSLKGEDANRRALELLNTISHSAGLQIITISDERIPREDILATADKVFEVTQNKGISKLKEVKG